MAVTKETVESRIQEIAKSCVHANVLEGKEAFELYNAIVGTTFDAESYNKIATEAPEYLMDHIPGGAKVIKEEGESEVEADEEVEQTPGQAQELAQEKDPEPIAEPIVEPTTEQTKPTATEVEAHKGSDTAEDLAKFDLDKDGDIDDEDVAKASEVEVGK